MDFRYNKISATDPYYVRKGPQILLPKGTNVLSIFKAQELKLVLTSFYEKIMLHLIHITTTICENLPYSSIFTAPESKCVLIIFLMIRVSSF